MSENLCLTGIVTKLEGVSSCMDGATHSIQTTTLAFRLMGHDKEAEQNLNKAADEKSKVTVKGEFIQGAECSHLSVYTVSSSSEHKEYIVISLVGSEGPKHQGCMIVCKDEMILMIYSTAYGPASKEECEKFVASNCVS